LLDALEVKPEELDTLLPVERVLLLLIPRPVVEV
jgi:hypothetical protein